MFAAGCLIYAYPYLGAVDVKPSVLGKSVGEKRTLDSDNTGKLDVRHYSLTPSPQHILLYTDQKPEVSGESAVKKRKLNADEKAGTYYC